MDSLRSPDDFAIELGKNEEQLSLDDVTNQEDAEHDALLFHDVHENGRETEVEIAIENTVPTRTKYIALGIYFLCNVGLTLYNKAVLGSVS